MNNKFCVSKKLFYVLLPIILILFITFSSNINKNTKTVQSNAAPYKIIGGSDVIAGEYPAVALIYFGRSRCTGTLINSRWVLTTAHCLIKNVNPIVAVGILNKKDFYGTTLIGSILTIPNPNYDPKTGYNDLALILLDKNINGVRLPKLPQQGTDENMYDEDNNVTAVGWGCVGISPTPGVTMTVNNSTTLKLDYIFSDKLQKISHPILDIDYVTEHYRYNPVLRPNEFYFGDINSNIATATTCPGDSGGPIFNRINNNLYIIGVVSQGDYIVSAGVKLINFFDWINTTIKTTVISTYTSASFFCKVYYYPAENCPESSQCPSLAGNGVSRCYVSGCNEYFYKNNTSLNDSYVCKKCNLGKWEELSSLNYCANSHNIDDFSYIISPTPTIIRKQKKMFID